MILELAATFPIFYASNFLIAERVAPGRLRVFLGVFLVPFILLAVFVWRIATSLAPWNSAGLFFILPVAYFALVMLSEYTLRLVERRK